ncbi:maleylpyruvate isomerase family mycothiol-dependent enzyme [Actinomycetospora straminea]|uniref:Maleylpyruvate isomerase family mycothiol-dependent enzyme n=1 Tax=Actinomycetospora straminea TaxID=663607 RepID=A0ABP9F7D0_9PSEU|nr:maleylpyruvate isomerase family mycothiol-dependent enzyme [Actinomycetospora straminea]MDD7936175.1 maleylpyruvate isomerase family mycothiol-dependent enzyme [Actinomycetospora straminea]
MTATDPADTATLLAATRTERAALADDLAGLTAADWATPSLCDRWSVEDTVAHLTAAASVGPWRWLRSVLGARFDFDLHNDRRLAEQRGATPAETLARFRAIIDSTTSTWGPKAAWLGEVVVHGEDVRRPLGLVRIPPVATTTPVADFFASRDFTVSGKTVSTGLHLRATDGPFEAGEGPEVTGPTLALLMVMAGRAAHLDDLDGPGVATLRERLR